MKLVLPDLISNSYFPAVAAADLGFYAEEGLDMTVELVTPVDKSYELMRDGGCEFVAGSAHSAVHAFPEWDGVKLIAAQGQGMYWFLIMRSDIGAQRGDLSVVKGRRIGAAPWVNLGLRRMLQLGGIDPEADKVEIMPVPGFIGAGMNFGVMAAKALEDGKLDGFWANGMGAEVAVRGGYGTMVLDIRRGDGPKGCFDYTMASIATTDKVIAETPDAVAAVVRALVKTHKALKADPTKAFAVGQKHFPPSEAALIVDLIKRDLPYYDATISAPFVAHMQQFLMDVGKLSAEKPYDQVVATQFAPLWKE
jgi:ABC-type nitrate/sulfonate/bicarbonate transport system substrate-binding protein